METLDYEGSAMINDQKRNFLNRKGVCVCVHVTLIVWFLLHTNQGARNPAKTSIEHSVLQLADG